MGPIFKRMACSMQALLVASAAGAQTTPPLCSHGGGFPCIHDGGRVMESEADLVQIGGLSENEAALFADPDAEAAAGVEATEPTGDNAAAATAAEAGAETVEGETKAELKARLKAEKDAERAAARAEKDAERAAARAEKDAERAAAKAEKDAAREAARLQKEAEQNAAAAASQAAAAASAAAQAAQATPSDRRDEAQGVTATGEGTTAGMDTAPTASEVTTETVTQTDIRRSDQDFDTAVTGAPQALPKKEGGLSKFEKALLLGLGAAVVGSALRNGDEVVSNSGDRVVVKRGDELRVLKDDDALLRRPGDGVRTETFADGSTRTTVTRQDGSQLVTIAAPDGRVLSRTRISPDGEATVIFDDTQKAVEPVELVELGLPDRSTQQRVSMQSNDDALRAALAAELAADPGRSFSLAQIRQNAAVRSLAPEIELDAIRFATGSAAIRPEQARALARIGSAIADAIDEDPRTVFLVEGHTDAVGDAAYNLALSDRRAETVALALTEYFDVPPENLIVQGYGESELKIPTLEAEQQNRRAVVRNITPLLAGRI